MNYLSQLNSTDLNSIGQGINLKFAGGTIGDVVGASLPYVFGFAGFALIIYIVFAGYSLMTSRGDQRAVAAAQAGLTNGIAGFLLLFSAYWVVQIVGTILDIDQITNIF